MEGCIEKTHCRNLAQSKEFAIASEARPGEWCWICMKIGKHYHSKIPWYWSHQLNLLKRSNIKMNVETKIRSNIEAMPDHIGEKRLWWLKTLENELCANAHVPYHIVLLHITLTRRDDKHICPKRQPNWSTTRIGKELLTLTTLLIAKQRSL